MRQAEGEHSNKARLASSSSLGTGGGRERRDNRGQPQQNYNNRYQGHYMNPQVGQPYEQSALKNEDFNRALPQALEALESNRWTDVEQCTKVAK